MASASELEDAEAELRSYKTACPPADKLSRYLKIVSPMSVSAVYTKNIHIQVKFTHRGLCFRSGS